MRITQAMRRLSDDLRAASHLTPPAGAAEIVGSLCAAYGRVRGGRRVEFRFTTFPPDTASGLWLGLEDRDLLVIEEHTRPEHQLVIACHELWHVDEGVCGRHGPGMTVAARLAGTHSGLSDLLSSDQGLSSVVRQAAARADREDPAEIRAETFGLHLGKILQAFLPPPREEQVPEAVERIKSSFGWGR